MDWFAVGVLFAVLTAGSMGFAFWLVGRRPGLEWPVIIVGALWGLVIGFLMWLALWADKRWPHRRRVHRASAAVAGAGFILAASYLLFRSPFDEVGPLLGSGRIERPEVGVALTFPDGWTVREVTTEGAERLWEDPHQTEGEAYVLAARSPGGKGLCWLEADQRAVRADPTLLATYAAGAEAGLAAASEWDGVTRSRIDLPAGPAWRFDMGGTDESRSIYLLRGRLGMYALICATTDSEGRVPADRWHSIAETFEFLPDPETGTAPSSPVLGGGRIERPADGFALTVPDDWIVEEVDPPTDAWLSSELSAEARALQPMLLWADGPDDDYCIVRDVTGLAEAPPAWTSIEEATAEYLSDYEDDVASVEPESELITVPAGRTGHVSSTDTDGWAIDEYLFTDTDRWFQIFCGALEPPTDRWLSIAQSFEFLPIEEPPGSVLGAAVRNA